MEIPLHSDVLRLFSTPCDNNMNKFKLNEIKHKKVHHKILKFISYFKNFNVQLHFSLQPTVMDGSSLTAAERRPP